jgi:WS/DGAT/MGAT family acyltransferase
MIGEQLSTIDGLFLNVERPNTPMHTAGVVIFEGAAPFQDFYKTIESRLHLVPRFTQKILEVPFGVGNPFWVDDPDFDLSFHLRHAALPAPGSDEQFCDFAARLISRPLDRTKPLWEFYVIHGLEGGRSAIVTKTHHAMVDGLATMDLATVLLDFGPVPQKFEAPRKAKKKEALPSGAALLRESVTRQVRGLADLGGAVRAAASTPAKVFEVARETAGAVVATVASVVRQAPSSPLNAGPSLHRRFAIVRSTLQTFKDIKNVSGATVNDVVLTVCADALGKLFRARDEHTEGRSLRVLVPVSVRDETKRMALGNEVTGIFPDLPIGKMPPLDRLKLVHDQLAGIKESKQAMGADFLVGLTRWAPATLHTMAARIGTRARLFNTLISNVPGPQVPLYSCGQKMAEPYAVIPLSRGQSLAIGVTSYNGGIFFGLNADRDSHPDLNQLARFIEESIKELEKAAREVTTQKVTPAKTSVAVGKGT